MRTPHRRILVALAAVALLPACGGSGGSPAPSIVLTSPNGGEVWYFRGPDQDITWTSANYTGNVNIFYSADDGVTWPAVAFNAPDTGTFTWAIPDEDSGTCLVRVQAADWSGTGDVSDAVFSIRPKTLIVTAPNGAEEWAVGSLQDITWTSTGVGDVWIEISRNNGSTWADIIASTPAASGTYAWTVSGPVSPTCLVRITDVTDALTTDVSDAVFSVADITITSPTGGEEWFYQGEDQLIRWSGVGFAGNVDIHYSPDNGMNWFVVVLNTPNSGSYLWQIPNVTSSQVLIRVQQAGGGISTVSAAPLTIAPATITVLTPDGGETWIAESMQSITWTSSSVTNVRISISRNGGATFFTVVASTPAAAGSYSWKVTRPSSANCIIRVADEAAPGNADRSDAAFTIAPLFVDTLAPLTGVTNGSVAWGDYDGNGTLDLAVTGSTSGSPISKLYKNTAGVLAEDLGVSLAASTIRAATWADYDNDGDLDLFISSGSHLYRNDGGAFTAVGTSIPNKSESSSAWGDFDNDGDLDVILAGVTTTLPQLPRTDLMVNNGGGSFSFSAESIADATWSSVAWGDYDRNGWLDLIVTGEGSGPSAVTELYDNSAGTLTASVIALTDIHESGVAWGDQDNDGYLDLALAGSTTFSGSRNPVTQVFGNTSGTGFTNLGATMTGVRSCAVAWGDYDNDGDLDLAVMGRFGSTWPTRIYRNEGAGTFVNTGAEILNLGRSRGGLAWGDVDGDGDLDLAICGSSSEFVHWTKVYRNDWGTPNVAPTAPTGLGAGIAGAGPYDVTFTWASSTDTETPQDGLSYNLRVGTSPGGNEISSGMADASGTRLLPARGMIPAGGGASSSWTLILPAGTYYWSVQAIDTAFEGSAWAGEQTLVVP